MNSKSKLIVNLNNIIENYNYIKLMVNKKVEVVPAVKADSYGVGAKMVVETLVGQGLTAVYVANIEEGIALRQKFSHITIYVLNGVCSKSEMAVSANYNLLPVINSPLQLEVVKEYCLHGSPWFYRY
jgi:alanine racemase